MTTQDPGTPALPTGLHIREKPDLSALRDLADPSQLTTLDVSSFDLSDLSPLAGLPRLTTLTLNYCWQVRDLSPLAGLPELTTLKLDCRWLSDLNPWPHVPSSPSWT